MKSFAFCVSYALFMLNLLDYGNIIQQKGHVDVSAGFNIQLSGDIALLALSSYVWHICLYMLWSAEIACLTYEIYNIK